MIRYVRHGRCLSIHGISSNSLGHIACLYDPSHPSVVTTCQVGLCYLCPSGGHVALASYILSGHYYYIKERIWNSYAVSVCQQR